MAINPRPVPPPLGDKMVDDNGFVTPIWGGFFNTIYRLQKNLDDSVVDATYTTGEGAVTDGTMTIENGVITAIQEAS